ncbi:MAG: tetratricopeptide repeat protein [Okeania sp. SIO3C4]|nr:tetratricopeptide repeat protein [Okeania sp. SIO3C4]
MRRKKTENPTPTPLNNSPSKDEKIGDRFEISITLNNLGKVYKTKGNLEKAKTLFERSLKIQQQIEDRQDRGVYYNELGVIYRLMKDYNQALEYF